MSEHHRRRDDEDLAYGRDYSQSRGYDDQPEGSRSLVGDALNKLRTRVDKYGRPQQSDSYGSSGSQQQSYNQSYGQPGYQGGYQPQSQQGQYQGPGQTSSGPNYGAGPTSQSQQPKPDFVDKIFNTLQGSIQSIGTDVAGILGNKYDSHHQAYTGPQQGQPNVQGAPRNRFDSFAPERYGNDVKWFVDGASYMWAVSEALDRARESIWILDWWLSPELYLRRPPAANEDWRLDRVLKRAADRGVKINIIVYKEVTQALTLSSVHTKHALEALSPNIGVFRHPDHLPDRQTAQSSIISGIQGLKLDAHGLTKLGSDTLKGLYGLNDGVILYWAHHEKLCLIDRELAFMGGLDLCYGRWDTHQHSIADLHPSDLNKIVFPGQDFNNARVMDFEDVAHPFQNKLDRTKSSRMGWSDISICLRGDCVKDLRHHFTDRWNFIYDEKYNVRTDVRYARLPTSGSHRPNEGPQPAPGPGGPQSLQPGQYPPPPGSQNYTQPPWQATSAINPSPSTSQYGSSPQPPSGQYGGTPQPPSGQYGSATQSSSVQYGSIPQPSSGQYGNLPPPPPQPPSGQYGNAPHPPQGQYGNTPQASSGQYGSTTQPSYSGSSQAPSAQYGGNSQIPAGRQDPDTQQYGDRPHTPSYQTGQYGPGPGAQQYGSRPHTPQPPSAPYGSAQQQTVPPTSGQPHSAQLNYSGQQQHQPGQHQSQTQPPQPNYSGSQQYQPGQQQSQTPQPPQPNYSGTQQQPQSSQPTQQQYSAYHQPSSQSAQPPQPSQPQYGSGYQPPTAQQPGQVDYSSQHGSQAQELPSGQPQYQAYGQSGTRGIDEPNEPYGSTRGIGDEYEASRGFDENPDYYGSDQDLSRGRGSQRPPGKGRLDHYRNEGRVLGSELGSIGNMIQNKVENKVYDGAGKVLGSSYKRPHSRSGGPMSCQLIRSCTTWSNGTPTEHSIQNAYIDVILNSQHFIYIENQFFITATGDKQKPVKNQIGKALVDRILRAARSRERYHVIVVMPAIPAFAGDFVDDQSLGTRAICEYQYNSICRGGNSIMEQIAQAGFNPMDYIRFYNLRNYDRINSTASLMQAQSQSGVSYEDARKQEEQALGAGYAGQGYPAYAPGQQTQGYSQNQPTQTYGQNQPTQTYGQNQPTQTYGQNQPTQNYNQGQGQGQGQPPQNYGQTQPPLNYSNTQPAQGYGPQSSQTRGPNQPSYSGPLAQQYQAAAQSAHTSPADRWDSVASCYMLNGEDIRKVPWSGPPEAEIDAFVSEELYVHSKVMIADDRVVICGSANINDRSMLGYHDSEIALFINDPTPITTNMAGRPYQVSRFASSLRRQLMRKHLGLLPAQEFHRPNDNFLPLGPPNLYDWGTPEDHVVSDPLSDTFLSLWNTRARTNTEVYRKAFRAVPDDYVRSWAEYKEFYEYYFHKADAEAAGKDQNRRPARVEYGHVVRSDFPGGVQELKELLSRVKGTVVEMPLCFLQTEDIAKQGLSLNPLTEDIYT